MASLPPLPFSVSFRCYERLTPYSHVDRHIWSATAWQAPHPQPDKSRAFIALNVATHVFRAVKTRRSEERLLGQP